MDSCFEDKVFLKTRFPSQALVHFGISHSVAWFPSALSFFGCQSCLEFDVCKRCGESGRPERVVSGLSDSPSSNSTQRPQLVRATRLLPISYFINKFK